MAQTAGGLLLLVLAAAVGSAGLAGFVASFVYSYADGPTNSNHYSGVWLSGIAMLMAVQAACVILRPSSSTTGRQGARFWAWAWYTAWMASCGLIILISLGIALPEQSGWAVLWIVASAVIMSVAWQHRKVALQQSIVEAPAATSSQQQAQHAQRAGSATSDVEANIMLEGGPSVIASKTAAMNVEVQVPQEAPKAGRLCCRGCNCSKASWRRCCSGFGSCMAWSSLFWAAVLGLFLVIQSAQLAYDKHVYPPLGKLVDVQLTSTDGSKLAAQLHIYCTGPITPGLSTFIMEAGGGSPGVTMAGIADGLAAASRRVCWYDRLGYGWSADAFKPATTDRSTEALHNLLAAVPDMAPPPYVLVGHSAGGQLAMNYAATYRSEVTGLALLDSYSDVAIYLYMMRGAGSSMAVHTLQRPDGTTITLPDASAYYAHTVPILDLLRAVTPLAWGRWITSGGKTGKYGAVTAALYGNNNGWHVQWVEVLAMASGRTLADDLTLNSGRVLWEGVGWPDFSRLPVLLLPAEETLKLPTACRVGKDYTVSPECVNTLRQPQAYCEGLQGISGSGFNKCMAEVVYPDLYAAYKSTLSSNSTLFVLSGGHGTVTDQPEQTVQQLLAKFAGV